jgi:hypothetical protein
VIRCVFAVIGWVWLGLVGIRSESLWFTVQFALIRCAFLTCLGSWTLSRTSGGGWQGLVSVLIGCDSLCIRCVFAVIGWDWLVLVGIGWESLWFTVQIALIRCAFLTHFVVHSLCQVLLVFP